MGPGLLWNLTEYVRRIGGARSDNPPLAYSIQPVLTVGDASALTTPLLPPIAFSGAVTLGVVAGFPTLIIISNAPGGTFIRDASWSSAGFGSANSNARVMMSLTGSAGLGLGVFTEQLPTPALNQMGVGVVSANFLVGTTTTALSNQRAFFAAPAGITYSLVDYIYLPRGAALGIQHSSTNVLFEFSALMQDVPATVPA